jgi:archaellum component FlaF (FlaF/FlaG flagellin family)
MIKFLRITYQSLKYCLMIAALCFGGYVLFHAISTAKMAVDYANQTIIEKIEREKNGK